MTSNDVALISIVSKFDEKSARVAAEKAGKTYDKAMRDIGKDTFENELVDQFNKAMKIVTGKLKNVNLSSYNANLLEVLFSNEEIDEKKKEIENFIGTISKINGALKGLPSNSFDNLSTAKLDQIVKQQEKIIENNKKISDERKSLNRSATSTANKNKKTSTIEKDYTIDTKKNAEISESLNSIISKNKDLNDSEKKNVDTLSRLLSLYDAMAKVTPEEGTKEAIRYSKDLLTVVKEIKETSEKVDLFTNKKASSYIKGAIDKKYLGDNLENVNESYLVSRSKQNYVEKGLEPLTSKQAKLEKNLTEYISNAVQKSLEKITVTTEQVLDKAQKKVETLQDSINSLNSNKTEKPIIDNLVDESEIKSLEDIEDRLYSIYDKDSSEGASNKELKEFISLYQQYEKKMASDSSSGMFDPELKEEYDMIVNTDEAMKKYAESINKVTEEKRELNTVTKSDEVEDNTTKQVSEITELEKKLSDLSEKYEKLNNNSNFSDDFNLTENEEFQQLSKEIDNVKQEIDNLKGAISQLTYDTSSFDGFANNLEDKLKSVSDTVSNLVSDIDKLQDTLKTDNISLDESNISNGSTPAIEQQNQLQEELKETQTQAEKTAQSVKDAVSQNQKKDAFPKTSDVASVEKIADGFKGIKQETEKATESAKEYSKILSQVGEYGVDRKVSAVYKRNDGQLESVNWRAKTDDNGQILYDKDGNIDYDFNMTVISKYEQLEKIIVKADDELRNLQKDLDETKNYNPNASTDNIEEKIADQKAYIQLLEQTVKVISQSDEYLMMEQQIIDARNKAAREYALTMGAKQEKSDAKKTASDEEKRLNNITQINRALNKQQILIDEIEKTYSKTANPDLDRVVSSQSDLTELANKKADIQNLINQLTDQGRNSLNENNFLLLEKYISEYKQLAKDKLKANNPSKQELGGQQLDVLLSQQVAQYNQLIAKAEKYGDATADIVQKLKDQRDTIAEINSDGIYTAKSGLKADDYYSARDNYKKDKAELTSYETDIKSASNVAKQEASNIQAEWDKNIKAIQDYMDAVTKLNNLKAKDKGTGSEANQIALQTENVEKFKQAAWDARQNLSSMQAENPDIIAWKQWVDMMELFDQASKGSAESAAKLKDVLDNIKAPSLDKYENKLSSYLNKTSGYDATIKRFEDGGWTSDAYLKNVQDVKNAVEQYENLLNKIKTEQGGIASEKDVQTLKEYEDEIKKTISTVQNMSASEKGYNFVSAQKELDKIHKLLNENSKMSSEAKAKIRAYYREIESGNPSMSLDKIHGEIMKIYNAEVEAGRAGKRFINVIKEKAWYGLAGTIGTYFGFNDIIRYGGEAINIIHEFDTALTEMRKVSDESLQSLKAYQSTTFDTADAVGTTAKQIQNSTADWMRLGESMDEAAESAKDSNVLLNVSEFDNIDSATESLVSMSQAYKDLDKMDIIDVLNNIGNNYSISTDGLATALKDSASALVTANNDLDEAVALTTSGNAITQDPSKVGAGLRTISLRLVGTEAAKQELSDLGEETDGMITTVSKLRDTIMDATKAASSDGKGFDILDSNGNYKSTYEIMQGLADLYDNIVKKDKELGTNNLNLLLETIAGKNRSNIAASILQNGDMLRSVYEDAQNSDGSAEKELNSYLDSVDGKMQQLQNRAQEFWFDLIDSETVKNGIDLLTSLVKGATDFVDIVGLLPPLLTTIMAALSFKNVGIDTLVALSIKSLLLF